MKRRRLVTHVCAICDVSERRACAALGIHRSSYRYRHRRKPDEDALREEITKKAEKYGAYGYRMVTGLLRNDGWRVNHKRVARIWREEGMKTPRRMKKKSRLWLNDGSCVRLRPSHRNHVWSYDFVEDRLANGRKIRMLTVIDEYSRESLAIVTKKRLTWEDVVECLQMLFILRGMPEYLRSDNGSEFTTERVRSFLRTMGVTPTFIEPVIFRVVALFPCFDCM